MNARALATLTIVGAGIGAAAIGIVGGYSAIRPSSPAEGRPGLAETQPLLVERTGSLADVRPAASIRTGSDDSGDRAETAPPRTDPLRLESRDAELRTATEGKPPSSLAAREVGTPDPGTARPQEPTPRAGRAAADSAVQRTARTCSDPAPSAAGCSTAGERGTDPRGPRLRSRPESRDAARPARQHALRVADSGARNRVSPLILGIGY